MSSKEKMTEADDVLEFLDSLPETKGTTKQRPGKNNETEDEHILDFLDELEQSNLTISSKKGAAAESLPREKSVKKTAYEEQKGEKSKPPHRNEQSDKHQAAEGTNEEVNEEKHTHQEVSDPIASLSSWWSSSGQATVSNMWSKTTKHANQLKDRLAQEQHELTTKLNTTSFTSKLTNTSVLADLTSQLTKIVVGDTEEVLRIHVVHDLVNFHGLSYQIESQFDEVLKSQVQGEVRIFVDQWDRPNETNSFSANSTLYQLNLFQGKSMEGDKLCMANLENAIKLFKKAKEEFQKQRGASDLEAIQEEESKISDVFVGILAVGQQAKDGIGKVIDTSSPGNFNFTFVLKDITNDISLIARSQGFPIRWVDWLEGKTETKEKSSEDSADIEVDPSEWIAEWIDQGLELSIGVLAQNYIIERMGI